MWKKVIAITAVVSLLWIGAGGVTTYYINWLDESHSRVLSENVTTIQECGTMLEVLWKLEALVMDAAQRGDHDFRKEIPEFESEFTKSLDTAKDTCRFPEETEYVKEIQEKFEDYRKQIHLRLQPEPRELPQQPPTVEETVHLADQVAKPCKQLLELNERLMDQSQESARN